MKKIANFSFITAVALSANMLPNNVINTSSLAIEHGGTKPAIDAYRDGAGAYVIGSQGGVKMDNSPMNNLVFKFGEEAKANNVRLDDQVITIDALTSTTTQKADAVKLNAVKLALEGTTCDDNNALTMLDRYENGVCVGTVMSCENGYAGVVSGNISCYDGVINTSALNANYTNLTLVGTNLWLHNNALLANIDALSNLTRVGASFGFSNNPLIKNLNGLSKLNRIGGNLGLQQNIIMEDINGLSSLTYVGGYIGMYLNPNLTNISGLNNLLDIVGVVKVDNRPYTVKLNANSFLCLNAATKLVLANGTTPVTKSYVCNP